MLVRVNEFTEISLASIETIVEHTETLPTLGRPKRLKASTLIDNRRRNGNYILTLSDDQLAYKLVGKSLEQWQKDLDDSYVAACARYESRTTKVVYTLHTRSGKSYVVDEHPFRGGDL